MTNKRTVEKFLQYSVSIRVLSGLESTQKICQAFHLSHYNEFCSVAASQHLLVTQRSLLASGVCSLGFLAVNKQLKGNSKDLIITRNSILRIISYLSVFIFLWGNCYHLTAASKSVFYFINFLTVVDLVIFPWVRFC